MGDADTVKLLYNRAFRAPSWTELYAQAEAEFKGNPDLEPETIDMFELDWIRKFGRTDLLTCALYYGINRDAIVRGREYYVNGDTVYTRGVDISWRHGFEKGGETKLAYSYFHNTDPDSPDWVESYSPEHAVKGFVRYPWGAWDLFGGFRYESRVKTPDTIDDVPDFLQPGLQQLLPDKMP